MLGSCNAYGRSLPKGVFRACCFRLKAAGYVVGLLLLRSAKSVIYLFESSNNKSSTNGRQTNEILLTFQKGYKPDNTRD
jgi:hypothetical protein